MRRIILHLHPSATFAAETTEGFQLEPGFIQPGSVELLDGIVPRLLPDSLRRTDSVVKLLARGTDLDPDDFLAEVGPAVAHLAAVTHSAPGNPLLEMARPGRQQGGHPGRVRGLAGRRRPGRGGLRRHAQ